MGTAVASILIIEDEENLRYSIARSLSRAGHDATEAPGAEDARRLCRQTDFDLILTDVNLNGDSGVDLVADLRDEGFDGAVVVMTAFGTIENAVRAMKLGAEDYLQKPLSLEELALVVERTLEHRRLRTRVELYERLDDERASEHELLGESDGWIDALALAERFAQIPIASARAGDPQPLTTILLLGETGVGKGLIARLIHDRARRDNPGAPNNNAGAPPFVHVNCSALPPNLVESELFGHEKGAFTDAKNSRTGLFELANGGTIFLDEIGETPPELQAKLLLVLEEGVFRRVGGSRTRRVRVRVIAATNQNIEQRINDGRFRRDLFYRLGAFTIRIPPLRERGDDASLIATIMLDLYARRFGRAPLRFAEDAIAAIRAHPWPGNVRELINSVQRAAMLARHGVVTAADFGLHTHEDDTRIRFPRASAGLDFDFDHGVHTFEEVERALIRQALAHAGGNITRAARLVGMNRSSFRYRIERCNLRTIPEETVR